jgi:diguanylate cyclase (GGDEF)-like protein/PAS domain S-box-containing protein
VARTEGILRLLIADDALTDAENTINALRGAGHAVRAARADQPAELEQLLTSQTWDLLICRDSVPNMSPADIVNLIQRLGRDLPVIVLIGTDADEMAFFGLEVQDVLRFGDVNRLQFAAGRELKNLFSRRLGRRNERALRESEKRSRTLLESSRDAVAYMHEGMHIFVNQAYLNLFGYEEPEDIDGLPMMDLVVGDDHNKFKSVFRDFAEDADAAPVSIMAHCIRADGGTFNAKIEFSHARVEGEACTQVVIRDDATFHTDDSQLVLLRDHDVLTGLYNRQHFVEELEKIAYQAVEGSGDAELLYLVLDDFQSLKEEVGLGAVDAIIKSVADLLRRERQEEELLARYSDQVFTIVVPSYDDAKVDERAAAYLKAISGYMSHIDGKPINLQASIGIARVTEAHSVAEDIIEAADKACLRAQRAGGNQIARLPDAPVANAESASMSIDKWEKRLKQGLLENKFLLNYQPIITLHGEEQEFYEVNLRLQLIEGREMKADEFIRFANQLNMMADIDKWIIRKSIEVLADHHKQFPHTRLFVKLSEQTIKQADFVDWLKATFEVNKVNYNAIIFEITETTALNNIEQVQSVVSRLKEVGSEFALEHFGSGVDFSNSLESIDVDYVKINGTFVERMARDAENMAAVKAIFEMSRQANKRCIAEYVSDANSMAILWKMGVDYAQGFYIQPPSDKLDYDFSEED